MDRGASFFIRHTLIKRIDNEAKESIGGIICSHQLKFSNFDEKRNELKWMKKLFAAGGDRTHNLLRNKDTSTD